MKLIFEWVLCLLDRLDLKNHLSLRLVIGAKS